MPAIGHNRPPAAIVRPARISADWTHPKNREFGRPRTWCRYWIVVLDGVRVDSFLTKKRALAKVRQLNGGT